MGGAVKTVGALDIAITAFGAGVIGLLALRVLERLTARALTVWTVVAVAVLAVSFVGPAMAVTILVGLVVAGVRQWAPTLFLNYKFGDKTETLRPWVGVGINHTTFKSSTNVVGNELYHDGAVRVKLSDSTGLAFQTGVTYQFDQNWSLQASWMTAAVKHNLTTYTDHSSQKATYRFHPSVFAAVVAYSF